MKQLLIIITLSIIPLTSYGGYFSAGIFTPTMESQDEAGEEEKFQSNLSISFGHNFSPLFKGNRYSPVVGYSWHKSTEDSYGDHNKKTIYILHDLALPIGSIFVIRYGFGNFMTKVGGDGGTVSLPNGIDGTSTGYKPGESRTSYIASLNLGCEVHSRSLGPIKSLGFRAEGHLFSFLSSEKRTLGYTLSSVFYF